MRKLLVLSLMVAVAFVYNKTGWAQSIGTVFTYQGKLVDGGSPANDQYDFEFKLFNALVGGNQYGLTLIKEDISVYEGCFTVELDFVDDPNVFNGEARWLQIGVRPWDSSRSFTILNPRQELRPAPYAIHAQTAEKVMDGVEVPGGGSEGYLSKFIGSNTLGDSVVYESDRKVGIGTTNPTAQMDVRDPGGSVGIYSESTGGWSIFSNSYSGGASVVALSSGGDAVRAEANGVGTAKLASTDENAAGYFSGDVFMVNGQVGIGTTAPTEELEVGGDVKLSKNAGSLILRTPNRNEPGRYALRFQNNYLAPFLGDDTQSQFFSFYTDFAKDRNYSAHLKVYGPAANTWGNHLDLTHDGFDGILATDMGDILLNPATGKVGIGTAEPQSELEVAGVIHSSGGGFKFPDGSVQARAANVTSTGNVRQLIEDFVVAAGETVTAGDVVSYLDGYVQKGIVYGDRIDFGGKYVFQSGRPTFLSAAALSAKKFVVVFSDVHNISRATAMVGEIEGQTITYGAKIVFSEYSAGSFSVVALHPGQIVVAMEDGDGSMGKATIGDIYGTHIIFGPKYVFNASQSWSITVAALSSSKFAVAYRDLGNSNYGAAVVGGVTGNIIFFGSEYVFNGAGTEYISLTALSSNKIAVSYQDEGNLDYGAAVIGDISFDAISFGSEYIFNSDTTFSNSIAALDAGRFVVAYQNGFAGTARIGEVSAKNVSWGSTYVFSPSYASDISVAILSDNQFIVAYKYFLDGKVSVGEVDGTLIGFDGGYNIFNQDEIDYTCALALSSTKFLVAYEDVGNSQYGTTVVGDPAGIMVGIAQETQTAYQYVPVIIAGVSDVHTGLVAGEVYYCDTLGNLTTDVTDYRLGLAISSSEILLGTKDNFDQFFGDMIFANNFKITEGSTFEGLILKNHLGREILIVDEEGILNINGLSFFNPITQNSSWMMFEDQQGLSLRNLQNSEVYDFVLQKRKQAVKTDRLTNLEKIIRDLQAEVKTLKAQIKIKK